MLPHISAKYPLDEPSVFRHTLHMYTAVTHSIQVTALPHFVAERSNAEAGEYFWAYTIEIVNMGDVAVQLTSRHWRITDEQGRVEEVRGPGVVGEQPTLKPGDTFRYTSGCGLRTGSGIMQGEYRMVDEHGRSFDVQIPAFSLDSPLDRRVLN